MAGEVILIVDRSRSALDFAAGVLSDVGYQVETTTEIWVAHLVRELVRPRLIMVDVDLDTAGSGLAVVQGLNAMAIRKEMVLLFYSSRPEEELVRLVAEYQADGYIMKGCSGEELERQVAAELGLSPRRSCRHPVA
ncbi:MAG: response regulator [bacterium]|nr:response regulator [bacterium]